MYEPNLSLPNSILFFTTTREIPSINMENFSINSTILVIFFLAIKALMVSAGPVEIAVGPSYDWKHEFPPVSPPTSHYLNDCTKKVLEGCSLPYYRYLMFGNNGLPSTPCCQEILTMGLPCHTQLTNFTLELRSLKPYKTQIVSRSEQIWKFCVLIAPASSL